jgi:hypothetical protein
VGEREEAAAQAQRVLATLVSEKGPVEYPNREHTNTKGRELGAPHQRGMLAAKASL